MLFATFVILLWFEADTPNVYLVARRSSATKHMSLFQPPASFPVFCAMLIDKSANSAETGVSTL